ncbi:hypothetical protein FPZ47_25975 [Mycobacterium helveticum]|uniref:Uncharacterized protein n=1 Tax=Mycobacterium helveticum TaxID=2592811 RepID=A0A557WXF3_9MYCO|nr:hypothetical protein FPZ47_25975 [Mycobacterium helveticum]TVS84005.1 hypothetical protein FPZ46_19145 [Mycobacterium helveticum]
MGWVTQDAVAIVSALLAAFWAAVGICQAGTPDDGRKDGESVAVSSPRGPRSSARREVLVVATMTRPLGAFTDRFVEHGGRRAPAVLAGPRARPAGPTPARLG